MTDCDKSLFNKKDLCHENQRLKKENRQLKEVLGNILVELKRYHNITKCDEIKVFINPHTSNLISEVFRKYGSLREE